MIWKEKLTEIRKDLPSKTPLTARHRRLTRKEVIEQKVAIYTRISPQIVRKRFKSINN